ncbi:hypothetical protein CEXT_67071 [Caerostris extrusa]|uniref:Uncharacterized protein n=1 Tax=Caerostris extrusa TaxID=172846 RepID=A0AAV4XXY0_CAEEX|nr:hypothetical protein CEXT_67071 [Caerostris extrusa]
MRPAMESTKSSRPSSCAASSFPSPSATTCCTCTDGRHPQVPPATPKRHHVEPCPPLAHRGSEGTEDVLVLFHVHRSHGPSTWHSAVHQRMGISSQRRRVDVDHRGI